MGLPDGISKVIKVDAVPRMPPLEHVGALRSYMGSVQFYAKFLLPNLSAITEPLNKLTRKGQQWNWGKGEEEDFEGLKDLLCKNNILAHYDPSLDWTSLVNLELLLYFFAAIIMAVRDQFPVSQRH